MNKKKSNYSFPTPSFQFRALGGQSLSQLKPALDRTPFRRRVLSRPHPR